MPSPAPGSSRLFTASTSINMISAVIIKVLSFSRPFWSPLLQIRNPASIVRIVKKLISTGLESMVLNTPPTSSAVMPGVKVPVTNLTK